MVLAILLISMARIWYYCAFQLDGLKIAKRNVLQSFPMFFFNKKSLDLTVIASKMLQMRLNMNIRMAPWRGMTKALLQLGV